MENELAACNAKVRLARGIMEYKEAWSARVKFYPTKAQTEYALIERHHQFSFITKSSGQCAAGLNGNPVSNS